MFCMVLYGLCIIFVMVAVCSCDGPGGPKVGREMNKPPSSWI